MERWSEIEWTWDYWIPLALQGFLSLFLFFLALFTVIAIYIAVTDPKVSIKEAFSEWFGIALAMGVLAAIPYGLLALYEKNYVAGVDKTLGEISRLIGIGAVVLAAIGIGFLAKGFLEDIWTSIRERRQRAMRDTSSRHSRIVEGFGRLALVVGICFAVPGAITGLIIAGEVDNAFVSVLVFAGFTAGAFGVSWGAVKVLGWIVDGFIGERPKLDNEILVDENATEEAEDASIDTLTKDECLADGIVKSEIEDIQSQVMEHFNIDAGKNFEGYVGRRLNVRGIDPIYRERFRIVEIGQRHRLTWFIMMDQRVLKEQYRTYEEARNAAVKMVGK